MNAHTIDTAARAGYEAFFAESRIADWDELGEQQKIRWIRAAREIIESYLLSER